MILPRRKPRPRQAQAPGRGGTGVQARRACPAADRARQPAHEPGDPQPPATWSRRPSSSTPPPKPRPPACRRTSPPARRRPFRPGSPPAPAPTEIAARWPTLARDEQRAILAALVDHVAAQPGAGNALDLHIHWRDGATTAAQVHRPRRRLAALDAGGRRPSRRALPAGAPASWTSPAPSPTARGVRSRQRYWEVVAPADRVKVRRRRVMEKGETYEAYMQRCACSEFPGT